MLGVRHKGDFYPTPHTVIEALLRHLTLEDTVWEPCAGDGRLVVALRGAGATVVSHDIATGHDFFEVKAAPATMVVTNPPCSCSNMGPTGCVSSGRSERREGSSLLFLRSPVVL